MNEAVLPRRIALIDVWRGIALVAMATYHGAGTLLICALSASIRAVRYPGGFMRTSSPAPSCSLPASASCWRRGTDFAPGLISAASPSSSAAAALVSVATYFVMPQGWVYFGILHQIALASVIALPFLRLPPLVTALAAALVIALPQFVRSDIFAAPWFWWVGLAPIAKTSFDYVPVFPWTGVVLAGVAAARFGVATGLDLRLARWQPANPAARLLAFGGRHSLAVYLIHQPIIYGALFLVAQLLVPNAAIDGARADCADRCIEQRGDTVGCHAYCRCVFDDLAEAGLTQSLLKGTMSEADNQRLRGMAMTCTAITLPNPAPERRSPPRPMAAETGPDRKAREAYGSMTPIFRMTLP